VYELKPPKMALHGGTVAMCKFRRSTVARLRDLSRRVPRKTALEGTTVGERGTFTGGKIKRHGEYPKQADTLCLLAAELAASIPPPTRLDKVKNGTSMLWYARAQLQHGSTLEALCGRLVVLLEHVDSCIAKHGEANVIADLDAATKPCSGSCNFHAVTALHDLPAAPHPGEVWKAKKVKRVAKGKDKKKKTAAAKGKGKAKAKAKGKPQARKLGRRNLVEFTPPKRV